MGHDDIEFLIQCACRYVMSRRAADVTPIKFVSIVEPVLPDLSTQCLKRLNNDLDFMGWLDFIEDDKCRNHWEMFQDNVKKELRNRVI